AAPKGSTPSGSTYSSNSSKSPGVAISSESSSYIEPDAIAGLGRGRTGVTAEGSSGRRPGLHLHNDLFRQVLERLLTEAGPHLDSRWGHVLEHVRTLGLGHALTDEAENQPDLVAVEIRHAVPGQRTPLLRGEVHRAQRQCLSLLAVEVDDELRPQRPEVGHDG